MAKVGFHASHEQFHPALLLECVTAAERLGYAAISSSDHFHPWSERQGHSGFAWAWLGAALARTTLPASVVTCPFGRYHPAVIAQACATLAAMFPGRFSVAVGSGEYLNEHITGIPWPAKQERNAMLRESVQIMRELWQGQEVSHQGVVNIDRAKLYTLPSEAPRVLVAALTPETARWAGAWADGLITVSGPREQMRAVIDAFRDAAGADKPVHVQAKIAYASGAHGGVAAARAMAFDQWRTNTFDSHTAATLSTTSEFDTRAAGVQPADMDKAVRISDDLGRHAEWLAEDFDMGADLVYVHNVGTNQEEVLHAFSEHVLPRL